MRALPPAILCGAVALLLAPAPVHAQDGGYCGDSFTYADSYIVADSYGDLNGYSTTYNVCWETDISVGVDAAIYDPNGALLASGSDIEWWTGSDASVGLSAQASVAGFYLIQGDHYYYFYDGGWNPADPPYTYNGAYSAGMVSPYAPTVTGVAVSGSPMRGGAGSATISGTYLAICGDQTTVTIDSATASVTSQNCNDPSQIGISYSIPANTATGSHQLTVTTVYGSGYGTFTVGDPTPSIDSIDPSTWTAGGVQYFAISGSWFGSDPSITITGDVGPWGIVASGDTGISAWVDLTYSSGGSVTVTVQSNGYDGNNFMEGSGGQSQRSQPQTAQVSAVVRPAKLVVTSDCYWPDGAQYTVGYTREITYQVLGLANQEFFGGGVPTVSENVTTITGPTVLGGGVWQRTQLPYTIDPYGRFTDELSTNGNDASTVHQSFQATDATGTVGLFVNIGGQSWGVLSNTYTKTSVTVAGTTAPRQCNEGDPK